VDHPALDASLRGPAGRAQGTLVGFDTSTPGAMRVPGTRVRVSGWTGFAGNGPLHRPTVEFTTADGTPVRAPSPFGSTPRPGRLGDTVTVLYEPRDPQRVRVETQSRAATCVEVAFMLFGGALTALGLVILIASR
jgi:hypothetical protein